MRVIYRFSMLVYLFMIFFSQVNTYPQDYLWGWGENDNGQLGNGGWGDVWGVDTFYFTYIPYPIQMTDAPDFKVVSAGTLHSLGLTEDNSVYSWGSNQDGQLGNGADGNTWSPFPSPVLNLTDVIAISTGIAHSMALKSDGTLWTWGGNYYGQLGHGTSQYSTNIPSEVTSLKEIICIDTFSNHSLAVRSDGTVWAWGYNDYGQLGDGTQLSKNIPVPVPSLTGIISVSAGLTFSLALKDDGTVWAWGDNYEGQLGDGTNTLRQFPVQVSVLTGVTAISAGSDHSLALRYDGTVWAWGSNGGAFGDGTDDSRNVPVQVMDTSNVVCISGGNGCSFLVQDDGSVWATGNNWCGELGDGTRDRRYIFQPIAGLSDIRSVSAGMGYALAVGRKKIQPPKINSIEKAIDPFRLKIKGSNFHQDLKVYISGSYEPLWDDVSFKSPGLVVLKKGAALKDALPKGTAVSITVANADGGYATTTYQR